MNDEYDNEDETEFKNQPKHTLHAHSLFARWQASNKRIAKCQRDAW